MRRCWLAKGSGNPVLFEGDFHVARRHMGADKNEGPGGIAAFRPAFALCIEVLPGNQRGPVTGR